MNRRAFLRSAAAACASSALGVDSAWSARAAAARPPETRRPPTLADRFPDLPRHFVFEYYPWYRVHPWSHWDLDDRRPPVDVASNYMPRLGAYDSGSVGVMEQHARWIAEAGVGAINVSWWGPGSDVDTIVPTLMDVMRAHGIHVTFHIEPYEVHHADNYARDVEYLIRQYGDRRAWDCFLLLRNEDGSTGPVFKSFRTILKARETDCHGVTGNVPDYAPDDVWRRQTDRVRAIFAGDFDRLTLLADSLDDFRTEACGFDGMAIYDNFVEPDTWAPYAAAFSKRRLLFSFNVNPGYDGIVPRVVDPAACPGPTVFLPGRGVYDWRRPEDRERAAEASLSRIDESLRTTIALQSMATLENRRAGFFLVYVTSFNEWHEGHMFEPMRDSADLSAAEQAIGYHNPADGRERLTRLAGRLLDVFEESADRTRAAPARQ